MKPNKLEKFLINRNLLENFELYYDILRNGTPYKIYLKSYSSRYDAIDMAFVWSSTSEGFDFWENIAFEWYRCLKNNIL